MWVGRKSLCWGEGCIEGKDVLRRWVGKKKACIEERDYCNLSPSLALRTRKLQ